MGAVRKQLRYLFLLQGIVVTNWTLSKLMGILNSEPNLQIQLPETVKIKESHCRLDDSIDGTRASLKSWGSA